MVLLNERNGTIVAVNAVVCVSIATTIMNPGTCRPFYLYAILHDRHNFSGHVLNLTLG